MSLLMEKLAELQQYVKCPKNQFNNFGKYHYRNCEDILEGIKPHLGDASLVLSDEVIVVGDRVYVKATATLYVGQLSISNTGFAREPIAKKGMDESQITGAASSYARKYALSGLLLLDDNKDADTQTDGLLSEDMRDHFLDLVANSQGFSLAAFMGTCDEDTQTLLFNSFEKGRISEGKKQARALQAHGISEWESFTGEIIGYIENQDVSSAQEAIDELEDYEKHFLRIRLGESMSRSLGALLKG